MTLDGTLRAHSSYRGERLDIEVWSLLAREWEREERTDRA